jgi:ribonuclease HII
MKNFDNKYLDKKIKLIAGVDEAGRGPLAGPVVAAAVIFSPDVFIEGVDDSKVLSEKRREELFEKIIKKSIAHSVSVVSVEIIEGINILNASLLAMKRSVHKLKVQPDLILIDGNKSFKNKIPTVTIVKGDYPTKQHRESIKLNGISPFHRKTFLRKLYSEIQLELTHAPTEVN